MSNQNKMKLLKTTLLTLSLATFGFIATANAGNSPFAQAGSETIRLAVKGDPKKCGEGKCGDNLKKATAKKAKKVTDGGSADEINAKSQEEAIPSDINSSEEKPKKAEKKCGS